jgi:hypothetical protein
MEENINHKRTVMCNDDLRYSVQNPDHEDLQKDQFS